MEIFSFFNTHHQPHIHSPKYAFLDIVFLIMTAIMSGAKTCKEIQMFGEYHLKWLKTYRTFEQGIPDIKTLKAIIAHLNPQVFNDIFINLLNEMRNAKGGIPVRIDRVVLHSNFRPEIQKSLHGVTVWIKPQGFVFTQHHRSIMKHEKKGVLEILSAMNLKNTIISVNALNTQKKIVELIRSKKANYIIPLKNSHQDFKKELHSYFHKVTRDSSRKITIYPIQVENNIFKICRKVPLDKKWLSRAKEWKSLKSLFSLESNSDPLFYLSSLSTSISNLAKAVLTHDCIDQTFSWELDIVYQDNPAKFIVDKNLNRLRNYILKLAHYHPNKESLKNKLARAMWSDDFRDELLMGVYH